MKKKIELTHEELVNKKCDELAECELTMEIIANLIIRRTDKHRLKWFLFGVVWTSFVAAMLIVAGGL